MNWTEAHDIQLCREIIIQEPFKFKQGSREKGQAWDKIATTLNGQQQLRFTVDQRAVRERYGKLERNYKRKMREEENASGISPEVTELDIAIQEIIGRSEGAQEEIAQGDEARKKAAEEEKETAENVRRRAMERLGETRARENTECRKRTRQSNDDEAIGYIREKMVKEIDLKKEELELRKSEEARKERIQTEEIELRKKELELRDREQRSREQEQEARQKRDDAFLGFMAQQQQQQQAMFQQMQQQNQAILSLIANFQKN